MHLKKFKINIVIDNSNECHLSFEDEDIRQSREMAKKMCELGNLRIDAAFKSHEAYERLMLSKTPPDLLLGLKSSRVDAFKNDQFTKASKLQQEVEENKKKQEEIEQFFAERT